jgi:phenylpropionate dioxygenase-like ring-hydroxylating dioxygenase large terminal subunit
MKGDFYQLITDVSAGTPLNEVFRRFWLPVALASELAQPDGDQIRIRVLGEDLIAFRDSQGRLGVLYERCPHRRASLFFGRNEQGGLRCGYHGWKFDVDGKCLDLPNAPSEYGLRERVRQGAYPARESGGLIWIYMGPREEMPEMPALDWADFAPERLWQRRWIVRSNYLQSLEGELDSSHITFLHKYSKTDDLPSGLKNNLGNFAADGAPSLFIQKTDYGLISGSRRDLGGGQYYWRLTQMLLPSTAIIPLSEWPVFARAFVPIDSENTMVFFTGYNAERAFTEEEIAMLESGRSSVPTLVPGTHMPVASKENDYFLSRDLQREGAFVGVPGINNQDRAMTESMGVIVDRERETLSYADRSIVATRQLIGQVAAAMGKGERHPAMKGGGIFHVRPLDIVTSIVEMADVIEAYAADLAGTTTSLPKRPSAPM